jgi:hypothetical protein
MEMIPVSEKKRIVQIKVIEELNAIAFGESHNL